MLRAAGAARGTAPALPPARRALTSKASLRCFKFSRLISCSIRPARRCAGRPAEAQAPIRRSSLPCPALAGQSLLPSAAAMGLFPGLPGLCSTKLRGARRSRSACKTPPELSPGSLQRAAPPLSYKLWHYSWVQHTPRRGRQHPKQAPGRQHGLTLAQEEEAGQTAGWRAGEYTSTLCREGRPRG